MPVLKVRDPISGNYVPLLSGTAVDHGSLTGLGDDDHPQYLKPAEVLAGSNVTVTTNPDGSVTIASTASGGVTDHGALTGLADDDHPQYVKKAGDTMTGPLIVDRAAASGDTLLLQQDAYPTLRFIKDQGSVNNKMWNVYISGAAADTGPGAASLTFLAEADDYSDQATFRMHRDGRMVLGADGTAATEAVTFRQVQKFSAYLNRATDTALTDTTIYNIAWESWSTPNGNAADHGSLTVGSTGVTISRAGMYLIMARVSFTGTTAGRVQTNATKNGTVIRTDLRPFATGNTNQAVITFLVDGAVSDKFSVSVAPYGITTPKLAAAYMDIVGPI